MPIEYWTGALAGWPLKEPLELSVSRSPVRITERARAALLTHHAGRKEDQVSGGLLLGSRTGGETRIDRTLPCVNVAPPEEREGTFRIDPQVLHNIERSAVRVKRTLLGIYIAAAESAELGETDLNALQARSGGLLMRVKGLGPEGRVEMSLWTFRGGGRGVCPRIHYRAGARLATHPLSGMRSVALGERTICLPRSAAKHTRPATVKVQ